MGHIIPQFSAYFCKNKKEIAPHIASLDKFLLCQEARDAMGNFFLALSVTRYAYKKAAEFDEHVDFKKDFEKCFQPAFIALSDVPAQASEFIAAYPNNCKLKIPLRAYLTYIYAQLNALLDNELELRENSLLQDSDIGVDRIINWYTGENIGKFRKLSIYGASLDDKNKSSERAVKFYLEDSYYLVRDFFNDLGLPQRLPYMQDTEVKSLAKNLEGMKELVHVYQRPNNNYSYMFVVPLKDLEDLLSNINTEMSTELVDAKQIDSDAADSLKQTVNIEIEKHIERVKTAREIVAKIGFVSYIYEGKKVERR